MRLVVAVLAGALSMPAMSACSGTQTAPGRLSPANGVAVHVTNQNFHTMDVYVISEGLATHLGSVAGQQSGDFLLDPSLITPDLRIVATPFGGNGRASTGPLVVNPGQTIDFRITQQLRGSSVFIRR